MIPDQMGVTPDVHDIEADGFHTIHCTGMIPTVDGPDDGPDCD